MSYGFVALMFAALLIGLASGHPLAFVLGGLGVIFGLSGWGPDCMTIFVNSIFGVMNNYTLVAIPLFVLMANFLTASNVTEGLFESVRYLLGRLRGGVGLAVIMVSTVFAACTGVVGASVITMGLLSIGPLLSYGYDRRLTAGLICAGGSLGILIPPSIMLVVMAATTQISVGKLFLACFTPGLLLAASYSAYALILCYRHPERGPALSAEELARVPLKRRIIGSLVNLVPPVILILGVLGSIYTGTATPTEASGLGAFLSLLMTFAYRRFSWKMLRNSVYDAAKTTGMCLAIMVGAAAFTSMFLGLGGDEAVKNLIAALGLGKWGVYVLMMAITFILGCFLDWMGIVMIVLPIFLPLIRDAGFDMVWIIAVLATMLQTCFLTPPFGYALFYLKGIAPEEMTTQDIYAGIVPFVIIIVLVVALITAFPDLAMWLPNMSKA
ncbi:MAG: TRAP transporter large permease subunit [Candidatus Adiutrix sp.]|jgi:tripartite ATP-independent transporter DctM subunit|nr:TRAP transporter large permease subunit [Candidatus Adiutrix sp.]